MTDAETPRLFYVIEGSCGMGKSCPYRCASTIFQSPFTRQFINACQLSLKLYMKYLHLATIGHVVNVEMVYVCRPF